jgi:hypothetical protein
MVHQKLVMENMDHNIPVPPVSKLHEPQYDLLEPQYDLLAPQAEGLGTLGQKSPECLVPSVAISASAPCHMQMYHTPSPCNS